MPRYVTVDKAIGETPLEATERARKKHAIPTDVPLAYAGRLDPMASGKLLILVGDECKRQTAYHNLDKEYQFSVVFGVSSDTGDVLGIIKSVSGTSNLNEGIIRHASHSLRGPIELPYPAFSSKTVNGKPLHTWAVEGRLDEINIPTKQSTVYKLKLKSTEAMSGDRLYKTASDKIESIPLVTDPRKALGNDFRRDDVRASWKTFHEARRQDAFTIAQFTCIASSGTYMRSLSEEIARQLGTTGLALSIHRSKIGRFRSLPWIGGCWLKTY